LKVRIMNDNVTSGFNPTVLIVDDSMLSRN